MSLALLDLVVGHKHTRRSRMSWSASSGMGLCASLVCSLFSSGVSCGWVLSGAVGCCRHGCRVLSGLSGLSGCRGCRGVSGLSGRPCKRVHVLTDILLSELSGCRGVGWCRGVGVVSGWCRMTVSGCQATPQSAMADSPKSIARRKWGRFLPHQRANVDQVPLPFVKTTWRCRLNKQ